jgi:hypothetical protein
MTSSGRPVISLLALGTFCIIATASASEKVDPVVVIHDKQYLEQVLKDFRDGEVFVANRSDAYAARVDLDRYVWASMKAAKSRSESLRWRQVRLKRPVYVWHCGGYTKQGSKFLYCTFSRFEKGREVERFPEVFDGGTDYCRGQYSLKARRLVHVECNTDE